jgi:hypothetical protein
MPNRLRRPGSALAGCSIVKIHPIPLEGSNLHCYQTTIASGQEEFLNGLAVLRLSRINRRPGRQGAEDLRRYRGLDRRVVIIADAGDQAARHQCATIGVIDNQPAKTGDRHGRGGCTMGGVSVEYMPVPLCSQLTASRDTVRHEKISGCPGSS